jgi:hypothetical protein
MFNNSLGPACEAALPDPPSVAPTTAPLTASVQFRPRFDWYKDLPLPERSGIIRKTKTNPAGQPLLVASRLSRNNTIHGRSLAVRSQAANIQRRSP